jgi:hypothetical protein
MTNLPRIGRSLAAAAALLLALGGAPALAVMHGGRGGGFHGGGFHGGWHGGWHGFRGGHFHGPHVFIDGAFFFGAPYFYDPFFYDYYPYPPYYGYYPPPPPPPPPPPDQEEEPEQEPAPEPPASYGLVQLRGVPDGAAVDLDGRFWLTAAQLDQRWLGLPEGTHTITVRRAGRDTVSRQVDVSAGSTQVVDFGSPY